MTPGGYEALTKLCRERQAAIVTLESENAALKAEVARARSDYEYVRSALWAAAGVFIEDDTEALRAVLTRIDARQHADGLLAKAQAEVARLRRAVREYADTTLLDDAMEGRCGCDDETEQCEYCGLRAALGDGNEG